jgi:hypothetical protein
MKITRELTEDEIANLTKLQQFLSKYLGSMEREAKTLKSLEEKYEALEKRRMKLERDAQNGSESASVALHGVIDQKIRLKGSIESAESSVTDRLWPLRSHINNAIQLINPICGNDMRKQIEDQIEALMLPYFSSPVWARRVAYECDALRQLAGFFNPFTGNSSSELLPLAERFITVIQALLAGGEIWEPSGAKPSNVEAPISV